MRRSLTLYLVEACADVGSLSAGLSERVPTDSPFSAARRP
jgi:hypothetical protein